MLPNLAITVHQVCGGKKVILTSDFLETQNVLVKGYLERRKVWKHEIYKSLRCPLSPLPTPQSSLRKGLCLNIFGRPWVHVQCLDGFCFCSVVENLVQFFLYHVMGKNILLSLCGYFKALLGKSYWSKAVCEPELNLKFLKVNRGTQRTNLPTP